MTEIDRLKQDIIELSTTQTERVLELWNALNKLSTEKQILEEVVRALAIQTPDLNPVMSRLLDRKDALVSNAPPGAGGVYSQLLDQWHTFLLHAQRIEQKKHL